MVVSEIIDGVTTIYCSCYDCKTVDQYSYNFQYGGMIPFTILAYNRHQTERREAYNAYIENKISTELEHSATEGDGGITRGMEHPGNVPTFFDIDSGEIADNDHLNNIARWATLHRASIKKV